MVYAMKDKNKSTKLKCMG